MSSVEQLEDGGHSDTHGGEAAAETPAVEAVAVADVDPEGERLPLDVVFDILRNQRRRFVYRYLREAGTAETGDLAERVAAMENEKEVSQLTSAERKRVYVGLYQCHLPRMDEAGVVEFDSDRGSVELMDRASQLDTYLGEDTEPERRWPFYYGGIVLVGAIAYGLSWFPALPAVLPSLVVLALTVSIAACALLHYRSAGRQ